MNRMTIDGYEARIEYDADIQQFRGEILGLNGGADFYGRNPDDLREAFGLSLAVFLSLCQDDDGYKRRLAKSGLVLIGAQPEATSQVP